MGSVKVREGRGFVAAVVTMSSEEEAQRIMQAPEEFHQGFNVRWFQQAGAEKPADASTLDPKAPAFKPSLVQTSLSLHDSSMDMDITDASAASRNFNPAEITEQQPLSFDVAEETSEISAAPGAVLAPPGPPIVTRKANKSLRQAQIPQSSSPPPLQPSVTPTPVPPFLAPPQQVPSFASSSTFGTEQTSGEDICLIGSLFFSRHRL